MPFCIKKILGCLILKLGGIGVDHGDADRHEHASAGTLVRRKRTGADELPEQLDHFRLAGNFSSKKEFTARKRQVSVLVIWYFILRPRANGHAVSYS